MFYLCLCRPQALTTANLATDARDERSGALDRAALTTPMCKGRRDGAREAQQRWFRAL